MIMSASMPFSLASASIVCINGFVPMFLKTPHRDGPAVIRRSGNRCSVPSIASSSTSSSSTPRSRPSNAFCRSTPRPSRPWPSGRRTARSRRVSGAVDPAPATTLPTCSSRAGRPRRRESCSTPRLTCSQSSMLTLSSAVAEGPGRSSNTRTTCPPLSRRSSRRTDPGRAPPPRSPRAPGSVRATSRLLALPETKKSGLQPTLVFPDQHRTLEFSTDPLRSGLCPWAKPSFARPRCLGRRHAYGVPAVSPGSAPTDGRSGRSRGADDLDVEELPRRQRGGIASVR